ncbi:RagB/SusD family nutrient uptake outer membrane protein [Prevotella sp. E13-17]|uniref:RagB/SusD family nutrient uptake outer membrane protein n=1 Tax=Prevotella sp. E13-17 TaxID=2913616 RepID=UPI001EDAC884|nr:RagB/SusD family nutrient uptake outer membrane protein [Prevotella sp. E13-17]UKK50921.1 RagB/SusD family nutrient uptake outer membrane protein [Prevotella sp. E13-17]
MKINKYRLLQICLAGCWGMTLTSCQDMMDMDSPQVVYDTNHQIDHANDSIYSVMGVLAQLQDIADRVVLMGELRGDLMTVDAQVANTDLQDIDRLQFSTTNQYALSRDFYSIINNCNYILAHMDTTITEGQSKVLLPEYAQVKTLRAYTYWQLALIQGEVNYFTQPLTDVSSGIWLDKAKTDLDALSLLLIDDLEPFVNTRALDFGSVDGWNSSEFFLPTAMLLGDLYLYNNRYEEAAAAYYNLICQRHLTVSSSFATTWQSTTRHELNNGQRRAYVSDVITRQVFDSGLRSAHSQLHKLTYGVRYDKEDGATALLPVKAFTDWMQGRVHFHTDNGQAISRYFYGDLRGVAELSNGKFVGNAFGPATDDNSSFYITKFYNNLSGSETDVLEHRSLTSLALLRPSTVYLRYAEAINRAGFPTTAFAVLKYGLNSVMYDTIQHRVDTLELQRYPAYIDFHDPQFNQNVGTAARGLGLGIRWDKTQYVIPAGVDSVDYVERAILEEMAAESCFEGNRFFDLLRISHHRPDHPLFMAKKVSAKYADAEAAEQRLRILSTWFSHKEE